MNTYTESIQLTAGQALEIHKGIVAPTGYTAIGIVGINKSGANNGLVDIAAFNIRENTQDAYIMFHNNATYTVTLSGFKLYYVAVKT